MLITEDTQATSIENQIYLYAYLIKISILIENLFSEAIFSSSLEENFPPGLNGEKMMEFNELQESTLELLSGFMTIIDELCVRDTSHKVKTNPPSTNTHTKKRKEILPNTNLMASNSPRFCEHIKFYWNKLESLLTEIAPFRDRSFYIWKRKLMKYKIAKIRSISLSKKYEVEKNKIFPSLDRLSKRVAKYDRRDKINKRNNHSHNFGTFFGVLESYFNTLKEFVADDTSAYANYLSDFEHTTDYKTTHKKHNSRRSSNASLTNFMHPLPLKKSLGVDHLFTTPFENSGNFNNLSNCTAVNILNKHIR
eukprot:gnl/TRDRNA2_/TRDRNA2_177860_c0_seq10.p1 gnl/TRDRNA2_/TRDRNA2_177860_c0~~gnl/TRDRNA2_/TRDRNA2_177860_c0_seq10.p1  ORF type:complete len:308 (+),score=-6.07 gnl/TRDRNA2_/TRDRNA2_177860_c0_seq10:27-950(+)